MKRLISVILILCMLFALSTFTLSAAGSDSVRETPYAVRSGPYLFVNFGQKYDWAVNASFVALAVSVGDTLCTASADGSSGHLQASGVLTWLNEEKTLAVFALHGGHGATVEEFFNGSKVYEGKTFPQWVSEKEGSAITLRVDCAAIEGVVDYSCHYLPIYNSEAEVSYPIAIREENTLTLLTGASYKDDGTLEAVRPSWSDTITFSALCLAQDKADGGDELCWGDENTPLQASGDLSWNEPKSVASFLLHEGHQSKLTDFYDGTNKGWGGKGWDEWKSSISDSYYALRLEWCRDPYDCHYAKIIDGASALIAELKPSSSSGDNANTGDTVIFSLLFAGVAAVGISTAVVKKKNH